MTQEIIKINNNTHVDIKRYLNGKVASKTPYVNGKEHGTATGWHRNGSKMTQAMLLNNEVHGMYRSWFKEGEKWSEIMYRNGKKHGMETYWRESGGKISEVNYIKGIQYVRINWDKKGNVIEADFPPLKCNNNSKLKSKQKTKKNDPRFS